ncbi:MAG: hypothetical protein RLZZ219_1897 [Cyanobacteriota bacterium]
MARRLPLDRLARFDAPSSRRDRGARLIAWPEAEGASAAHVLAAVPPAAAKGPTGPAPAQAEGSAVAASLNSHAALAAGFRPRGPAGAPLAGSDPAAGAGGGWPSPHRSCGCPVCSQLEVLNADVETLPAFTASSSAPLSLATSLPTASTFLLHSNPTASHTVFLDFDGHTMAASQWENGGPLQLRPFYSDFTATATLLEIQRIWQRIAEDFAPFHVNVTTQDPGAEALRKSSATDTNWGIRMAFTYNQNLANGGAAIRNAGGGGTAYIGSFNWSTDEVALGFNRGEYAAAETGSHEIGHSMYLYHDGTASTGYYGGHGSGDVSWGTIMGAAFIGNAENLTTWSKGEYYQANNSEDDLGIITSRNGFGYRTDDHGGQLSSATLLSGQSFSQFGVIERSTDRDWFRFDTGAGAVNLTISNAARVFVADGSGGYTIDHLAARGPNLDISASLYRADGSFVASSNPLEQTGAAFTDLTLAAGTYYVAVEGVGFGSPLSSTPSGYTDYASLGQYMLSGTVQPSVPPAALIVSPASLTTSEAGAGSSFSVSLSQAPLAEVVVSVSSADPAEVSVTPASLTFTPLDWATPRLVAVAGVDDRLVDGDRTVSLSLSAVSADPAYAGLVGPSLTVVNSDDDVAVIVSQQASSGELLSNVTYQSAPTISPSGTAALEAIASSDDIRLSIREGTIQVTSGSGKRLTTSLTSALSTYQWSFVLEQASSFVVEGFSSSNSENDAFRFELSTNGGSSWSTLLTVGSTAGDASQSVTLATPITGTALVRVVDTNRSAGAAAIDTLHIDRLGFESRITDLRPTLGVTASEPQAVESPAAPAAFTITRSEADAPLSVRFSLGGTASAGVDFTLADGNGQPLADTLIQFAAGQASAIVQVLPAADGTAEAGESVLFTLDDPGAAARLTTASATVTIVDAASGAAGPFTSSGETPVVGSVSGGFTATASADGVRQVLTEVLSGGKSGKGTSQLEHQWRFDAITGAGAFRITASTSGTEQETFDFLCSRDGGLNWTLLGSVAGASSVADLTWTLAAAPIDGSVLVKVVDRDRAIGNLALDAISIDAMAFLTGSGGAPAQTPVAEQLPWLASGSAPLL